MYLQRPELINVIPPLSYSLLCKIGTLRMLKLEWNLEIILFSPFVDE